MRPPLRRMLCLATALSECAAPFIVIPNERSEEESVPEATDFSPVGLGMTGWLVAFA